MIHISKTKRGQFSVTNMAANGEVLKPSETFKRKQSCWVNIRSEMKSCYLGEIAVVQDNTGKAPKVYFVRLHYKELIKGKRPEKPHTPK